MRLATASYSFVVLAAILLLTCPGPVESEGDSALPEIYYVKCVGSVEGCACYDSAQSNQVTHRLFHAEAAIAVEEPQNNRRLLKVDERTCWYPSSALIAKEYAPVLSSDLQRTLDHSPLSLSTMLGRDLTPASVIRDYEQRDAGYVWPTYYHLALEDFHPGPPVNILSRNGRVLGRASREFLRQVTWEGSGIAKNGLRLHYTGTTMRFETYAGDFWGHGAGYGYRVSPYRTIAVNYPGLCTAFNMGAGCRKRTLIGTLVFIPQVAEKEIRMADGSIHDGFFCVTDTGSPYYIRSDRIDIFVGVHGGGNPYLPPARQRNHLIDGGIENLVPSDWRLWRTERDRVWCDSSKLPDDIFSPGANDCTHDYHVVARDKALQLYGFFQENGEPLRCIKEL